MTTILLILILVTGYSAIKIINEIIKSNRCPEDEILKKVVLGRMNKESPISKNIIKHLGICEKCRDKINEII